MSFLACGLVLQMPKRKETGNGLLERMFNSRIGQPGSRTILLRLTMLKSVAASAPLPGSGLTLRDVLFAMDIFWKKERQQIQRIRTVMATASAMVRKSLPDPTPMIRVAFPKIL